MKISFIEIQNFRKLRSVRVDFAPSKTVFVGANNSGKTSAMISMGHFLVDHQRFSVNDFTLSNWNRLNSIGSAWEDPEFTPDFEDSLAAEWGPLLPTMDVWIEVDPKEIHYVCHLLPSLSWKGEGIGVRLRYEPKDLRALHAEYLAARKASRETVEFAKSRKEGTEFKVRLWPSNMQEFLERRMRGQFVVRSYLLDPQKVRSPENGHARPQPSVGSQVPIEGNPFENLIRIDEIQAQRGFSDAGSTRGVRDDRDEARDSGSGQRLSGQLRKYYTNHINPSDLPEAEDVEALDAIHQAQEVFDTKLREGFNRAFSELEDLGYPGVTNPKLRISTRIEPIDGLRHASSLQYDVISNWDDPLIPCPRLPEQYNGLGYQNLISMVFRLMSFRDAWMQVGKAEKRQAFGEAVRISPLHVVLVEEPEAHLHAQVQQIFIRRAYEFLRNHGDLGSNPALHTQLIVSTHSSHIVHECEFGSLRYFRRIPATAKGDNPTTAVVNMSEVFGSGKKTAKFVTRYLKATHCDLFFADAAIFVEGLAEKILVPHFIREKFDGLRSRYLTILEVGGSHAHRFSSLIEHLGLTTLVITDLDSASVSKDGKLKKARTRQGQGLVTNNSTLRNWLPKMKDVDGLLDLGADRKIKAFDDFMSVRVAYQTPIQVSIPAATKPVEVCPYTFEDSLVLENLDVFRNLSGIGMIKTFKKAVHSAKDPEALSTALFDALKNGDKGEFAAGLIYVVEPSELTPPKYIQEGLTWLDTQMRVRDREVIVATPKSAKEEVIQ